MRPFYSHGFIKLILANEDYVVEAAGGRLMVRFKENFLYPDTVMMHQSVNANKMVVLPFVWNRHAAVDRSQVLSMLRAVNSFTVFIPTTAR